MTIYDLGWPRSIAHPLLILKRLFSSCMYDGRKHVYERIKVLTVLDDRSGFISQYSYTTCMRCKCRKYTTESYPKCQSKMYSFNLETLSTHQFGQEDYW